LLAVLLTFIFERTKSKYCRVFNSSKTGLSQIKLYMKDMIEEMRFILKEQQFMEWEVEDSPKL
jgi:hypothetical protein